MLEYNNCILKKNRIVKIALTSITCLVIIIKTKIDLNITNPNSSLGISRNAFEMLSNNLTALENNENVTHFPQSIDSEKLN